MPAWQVALEKGLAVSADVAVGLAPLLPLLLFLWLVDRASRRLPLAGKAVLVMAATSGAAVGLGAVLLSPLGRHLTPSALLNRGAWWDVSGRTLVGERIGQGLDGLGPMLGTPLEALPPVAAILAAVAVIAALVAAGAAFGGMRLVGLPMLPLLGGAATAGAAAAVLGVAAVCVLAWTLSLLNFWTLAIVLALWQRRRHAPSRV